MSVRSPLSQSLAHQLIEVFEGDPWYGESLMHKLNKIRQEADTPQTLNKTASYVHHLINWRQFVIKKLEGEAKFDIILNTSADWRNVSIDQYSEWDLVLTRLSETQNKLLDLIKKQTDKALQQKVPGKNYNYEQMIHGLIQHDVYHTGQIAVYWKNR